MAQGLAHRFSLLRGASKSHANNSLAEKCGLSRPPEQGNVTGGEGMVTLPNESGDKRGWSRRQILPSPFQVTKRNAS